MTETCRTTIIDVHDNSQIKTLSEPLTITLSNVTDKIVIRVEGWEVDYWFLGETGRVHFGPQDMTLTREQLVHAIMDSRYYNFGTFVNDDGEYTATVQVSVSRN